MGRPGDRHGGGARSGFELVLWADPLHVHDEATPPALRTLARAVRPGGHALVAVSGEVDDSWEALFAACALERLGVERSVSGGTASIAWLRRRVTATLSR